MQALNLQKQTLIKTSPLSPQSLSYLLDKKRQLLLISQTKAIHIYNLVSQTFQTQIKTSSISNISSSSQISCVTVSDDLLFFGVGMHVAAAGYNGKVIFDFDTFIAGEKIDRIHVVGYRLWVITGNILNQFMLAGSQLANKLSRKSPSTSNKVQDIHSHMFQSTINSSFLVQDEFSKHFLIILTANNQIACYQDKQLCTYKTSSPPTTIIRYPKSKQNRYLVGTMSGQILHLQITRKNIKQIWKIGVQQSKGKVNLLIEAKNQAIFVGKDKKIEVWGQDRTILAEQDADEKYICGLFLTERQLLIAGSTSGTVIQMRDYAKMMKDYQQKNQNKAKQELQKQIAQLKAQYEILKTKSSSLKTKQISTLDISVQSSLSLDYQNKCTCLQLKSQSKITKIILKGNFQMIKCSKLSFSHYDKNQDTYTYTIQQQQNTKISKTLIKFTQNYQQNNKIKLIVYLSKQNKIYAITRILDNKNLCYHQKIPKFTFNTSEYNQLSITGGFKYFQINMLMHMIFYDFGQAQAGDVYSEVFYQSIHTGQKLIVKYKNGECLIYSVNPAPLIVIKQFLVQKSKQKHFNLNFSTQVSVQSVKKLVLDLQKILKPLQKLKKQAELLPGVLQLQNQQSLSQDLKDILSRSQQIKKKHEQSQKNYQNLLSQLRTVYKSYQKIKEHQVTQFQLDNFNRVLLRFDSEKIINMILA